MRGPLISLQHALKPSATNLHGRTVFLEKLGLKHVDDLYAVIGGLDQSALWDYMSDGPYKDEHAFRTSIMEKSKSVDAFFYAVVDRRSAKPVGYLSLMRIVPEHLTLEIGNAMFSPNLQRTTCATEAFYLISKYVFDDLHYRRLEWKCNALNEPSRRAALRLVFTFEGIFRQQMVFKDRSRDTAWFSILRDEWDGALKEAMEGWLNENNFGLDGSQIKKLQDFR
jgi:RimJ/RimL family protein N-acetyltransferase